MENGAVFDRIDDADVKTNASVGALVDTLIGPMLVGGSFGFIGTWRYYVGIGRIF